MKKITYNEVLYYEVATASLLKSFIWAWVLPNWMIRTYVTNKMNTYNSQSEKLFKYYEHLEESKLS